MRNTITPKQQLALEAFLGGASVNDAASVAGVKNYQVSRWLHKDPVFSNAIRQAEAETLASLSRQLTTLGGMAGQALEDSLGDDVPTLLRLRAADIVLARLLQLRELVQLEARVEALELQIKKDGDK